MQPPFQEIQRIVVDRDRCPYLPDRSSEMEFEFIVELSASLYQRRLARGWRRQGMCLFRPVCRHCQACVSLRLPVHRFSATRSQRRAMKRNAGLHLEVREPEVTPAHLDLFNHYHADMNSRRGWEYDTATASDYFEGFLSGRNEFAREFAYFEDRRLVAVGLVDCLDECASSIYFYHDPLLRHRSLGTYSLLREIEHARDEGRQYHYLGYWIRDCGSMEYKSRFGPHELLTGLVVDDDDRPEWRPASSP